METKQKMKLKISKSGSANGEILTNEINMDDVRDFTKKLSDDKKTILENSFDEIKRLTKQLTDLKLQNEELEIVVHDIMKEKEHVEDSYHLLNGSYDSLLSQYTETRKLLQDSHGQNVKMSEILEKMRDNEKCLITEIQKLRKYGSLQDSAKQSGNIRPDTITDLEKELRFWQHEAEKLSQIIEINDKKLQLSKSPLPVSKKRGSKQMKRYNKVVNRSHSVETSQRKSKELEFEKLKTEKMQMKNLLNDLEKQVFEIQNNVIIISDERQKYKDFYYSTNDKLKQTEDLNVNLERKNCDVTNENSKLCRENQKLAEQLDILLQDNNHLRISKEEVSKIKIQKEHDVQILESKIGCLVKENHDIGVRSNNLKNSIISLESDFKEMEKELHKKDIEAKEYLNNIGMLDTLIADAKRDINEKNEHINIINKKMSTLEEIIEKLRKSEDCLMEKLDVKAKEVNFSRTKEKENEETIHNIKSSFSAHVVKLELQIQNAEQIISSKIKLIASLELKVANYEKELKTREEEILYSKKLFNSKEHDFETLTSKYEEIADDKRRLENYIETLSSDQKVKSLEVASLNEVVNELKSSEGTLKSEIKSLKETLHRKEDQMLIMDTQIERQEREIPQKTSEICRYKKMLSQLENEIDQKESHIGSLLSLLAGKEEKLVYLQTCNDENERKVKEYTDELNRIDDDKIQSTARTTALEGEIESLQNNNIRLIRQKEHLSQMLSSRNISIGQLQAQLADKHQRQYLEKISIVDDFPEFETNQYEDPQYSTVSKKNRDNERVDICPKPEPRSSERLHYDKRALRNRSQCFDGRSMNVTNGH